jgi:hypothetical protein
MTRSNTVLAAFFRCKVVPPSGETMTREEDKQ